MWYPLTFQPLFMERIWGGRELETLYHKALPAGQRIGESWEITDRPEAVSVVANGPLAGQTLHNLLERHPAELLGATILPAGEHFPLLVKILDAQDALSLQVHPPAPVAGLLGGEPKTEIWHVAQAAPGAEIIAGLKRGVTRGEFEKQLGAGLAADCLHRIPVKAGDTLFLPSGRVHAIGRGLVIFEIQQNSDTTYRVFDWNRMDHAGRPRPLHVAQAMMSIDFNDFEPGLVPAVWRETIRGRIRILAQTPFFHLYQYDVPAGGAWSWKMGTLRLLGVLSGQLHVSGGGEAVTLSPGQFCLLPAALLVALRTTEGASFLETTLG